VSGDVARLLNALGLMAIALLLLLAFIDQLWFGELPCPLCILQRLAYIAAGFGLALNLIFGSRPSHYGLTILGATAGAAIALRQIVLHIVPGTGAYGEPILGLHIYTWSFVFFALIIIGSALMLLGDRQFARAEPLPRRLKPLPLFALSLFLALVVGNLISTLALCGLGDCPGEPQGYLLLQGYFGSNITP
jgi:disulfide bond formation protein DsbB